MVIARANPRLNFGRLIAVTQQIPEEVERTERRRDAIKSRLSKSFDVAGMITIGSFSRGTALRGQSDVDLLANLRRSEAKWGGNLVSSSRVLQRVRDDLNDRFVTTNVRRDGQAAVVSFAAGKQKVDVVPAIFLRFESGSPIYGIPDGAGGWLETSPRAHLVWLRRENLRSGGKLNKAVRLVKHWKQSRTNTQSLRSFYLELWMASSGVCIGAKSYGDILFDVLSQLDREGLKTILDPAEISGHIAPTQTDAQRDRILPTIRTCLTHAQAAIQAERAGTFTEANRQWNIVFNGSF